MGRVTPAPKPLLGLLCIPTMNYLKPFNAVKIIQDIAGRNTPDYVVGKDVSS